MIKEEKKAKSLLIVDDEETICKPLKAFFSAKGYNAITARNGLEALDTLEKNNFDLMIVDLKMPKMGGVDLIKIAKKDYPYMPIIVLSGVGNIKEATETIKLGAFDYMQKPIMNFEEFERIVKRAIEHGELEKKQKILQNHLQEKTKKLEEKIKEINLAKKQLEKQSKYLQKMLNMIEEQNLRMEEDLNSAQHIQEDLLPKELPQSDYFKIAAQYIPSGTVAGDMYDAFFDPSFNVHLYMADVAGHGVSAAMVTVFLKKSITPFHHFTDMNTTPKEILNLLNEELIKANFGRTMFVTMLYSKFNPVTNKLTISSAGHPPLILKREGQKPEAYNTKGIPLGWRKSPNFEEKVIDLQKNDRIILYTDGITDAMDLQNKTCGVKKLLDIINDEKINSMEPEEVISFILNSLGKNYRFYDDISLLVLALRDKS